MQAFMNQYIVQSADQFRGIEQCYNPAPASTLQLADQRHNVMPSPPSGVGSAAADAADAAACVAPEPSDAAAAAPTSAGDAARKQYQKLKAICHGVDKCVKEVQSYCLSQGEEGHISNNTWNVINSTEATVW